MKRLFYFTDSYPFSADYTWKSAEIEEASKEFTEVIIIPFTFQKENGFSFPANVRIVEPTIGKTLFAKLDYIKHIFSKTQPQSWVLELFRALVKGKGALVKWYLSTVYSDIIVNKPIFQELKGIEDKGEAVLFFQWTMNNALLVPMLHQWGFVNIVCRMHGYDLYEFRHQGYIPYKSEILKHAAVCTFISKHGKEYATEKYPFIAPKSHVHYLGAMPLNKNELGPQQTFHLLSISRAVPLKRIELIAEALEQIQIPIKWTHIGDGSELERIKDRAAIIEELNSGVSIEFLGWLDPEAIRDYISRNGINALVLVSETEGLPVVIMEAFSAGIPVIATNVGGVSELVNEKNGILLSADPKKEEITKSIEYIANESMAENHKRRSESFDTFEKSFDLYRNSKAFIHFLAEQCH